jgi:hypothetical protein
VRPWVRVPSTAEQTNKQKMANVGSEINLTDTEIGSSLSGKRKIIQITSKRYCSLKYMNKISFSLRNLKEKRQSPSIQL